MSSFGSRQLGFFTSKGSGGSASYQNLQQTLGYGNQTTNTLNFYVDNINSNRVTITNSSTVVYTDTDQNVQQPNLTQITQLQAPHNQTLIFSNAIQLGNDDNGIANLNFKQPYLGFDFYTPTRDGTLGIRSLNNHVVNIDLTSSDFYIGQSPNLLHFNTIYVVTNGSGDYSIYLDPSGVDKDIPFYICYANTDGLGVSFGVVGGGSIKPIPPPSTGNGFVTFIYQSNLNEFWCDYNG